MLLLRSRLLRERAGGIVGIGRGGGGFVEERRGLARGKLDPEEVLARLCVRARARTQRQRS